MPQPSFWDRLKAAAQTAYRGNATAANQALTQAGAGLTGLTGPHAVSSAANPYVALAMQKLMAQPAVQAMDIGHSPNYMTTPQGMANAGMVASTVAGGPYALVANYAQPGITNAIQSAWPQAAPQMPEPKRVTGDVFAGSESADEGDEPDPEPERVEPDEDYERSTSRRYRRNERDGAYGD